VLDVVGKLDLESRNALFACVMTAHRDGAETVTPEMIAGSLLRTPSAGGLCSRLNVNKAALLDSLGVSADVLDVSGLEWPSGMFVSLPVTDRMQALIKSVSEQAADQALESVPPARLLAWLLDGDQLLRDSCARFGLTSAALGDLR
jgi:hypothetical protein